MLLLALEAALMGRSVTVLWSSVGKQQTGTAQRAAAMAEEIRTS